MYGNGHHLNILDIQVSKQVFQNTMTNGLQIKRFCVAALLVHHECQFEEVTEISSDWMRDGYFLDLDALKILSFLKPKIMHMVSLCLARFFLP